MKFRLEKHNFSTYPPGGTACSSYCRILKGQSNLDFLIVFHIVNLTISHIVSE